MAKNIIKTFIITSIMFLGVFFINIDNAKADCTCYYYADKFYKTGSEAQGGGKENKAHVFLFNIKYSAKSADVTYSCSATGNSMKTIKCENSDGKIQRGNPFDVDSAYISEQKCSESACNSANLKLWCGTDVVTDGYNPAFCQYGVLSAKAITKEQSNDVKEAENAAQAATEAGISGATANIGAIIDWGDDPSNEYKTADEIECQAILAEYEDGKQIVDFLNNLLWIISIIGIILLIIMTSIEFIKVVTGQDDSGLAKAFKHTLIRALCVVILLLLPLIITSILNVVNENASGVKIGPKGEVLCGVGE